MNAHDLRFLYGINQAALHRNAAGLTHDEKLLEDFDRTQAILREVLDGVTPEALAAPGGTSPIGELDLAHYLAFLQFHEAYHIGQLGVLRRLAGREGAIR